MNASPSPLTISSTGCSLRPFIFDVRLAPVLIFNLPSRKFMSWIVGDISSEDVKPEVKFDDEDYLEKANPFKSTAFILLFVCGLLLSFLVPLSLSVFFCIWRRKRMFNVSNATVALPAMDVLLLLSCVFLCFFTVVIIWNNDMLTPNLSKKHTNIAKRLEDHEEMLQCQISRTLVVTTTTVYSQTEDIPELLKKAFNKTANYFLRQQFDFFNRWRESALRHLKKLETDDSIFQNDLDQLTRFLSEPLSPDTLLGDPVYVKKDDQQEQSQFMQNFLKAVSEEINDVKEFLEYFQYYSFATSHKVALRTEVYSSATVFVAILMVCVVVLIRICLLVRACSSTSQSSSKTSKDSLWRRIVIRLLMSCAIIIAIFGLIMFSLSIWGVYSGYVIMYIHKTSDHARIPQGNLSYSDSGSSSDIDHFLSKCYENENFLTAMNPERFLNSYFMAYFDINLDKEVLQQVTDEDLEANIEKYMNNVKILQKKLNAANEIYERNKKRLSYLNPLMHKLVKQPMKLKLVHPKVLPHFKKEVSKFRKENTSEIRYRDIVAEVLAKIDLENHRCYDIADLWLRWQKVFVSDITGPLQGQWTMCILVGLLSLFIFIPTMMLSTMLSALEDSQIPQCSGQKMDQKAMSMYGSVYRQPRSDASREPLLRSTMGQPYNGQGGFPYNNDPLNSTMGQSYYGQRGSLYNNDPLNKSKDFDVFGPSNMAQTIESKQEPITYPFKPPINSVEEKGNALDGKSYMDELFMKDPTLIKKSSKAVRKSPTDKARKEEPKNEKNIEQKGASNNTYPFKPPTNIAEEKGNALDGKSYMDELFMKDPTLIKKSNETVKKSPTGKAKTEEPKNEKNPEQKAPDVKKDEKKEPPQETKPKKLEKEKQSKPNGSKIKEKESKIKEKEKANANLNPNKTSPDEMRI